ncbi:MAG: NUDIX hydrolase [Clostridia bacterium]|nr:NUDIX hydrolase [Clostridia bacterium]MBQ2110385.1 NUDIX hydrolase [Clostridia bacterium]MBQ2191515.1 NUDIX hydrolase [Clostridia bacterium]MBQ3938317.1 NUDIX hydrolase [Clostridia bacterium]MBQ5488464.1 NUDIX hydrolase [Clostridia bacterium]
MNDEELKWKTEQSSLLLHTPVFDVWRQTETASTGLTADYVAMTAPDWVVIVPVYKGCFVMVRQWRHGEDRLTVEFPGGVMNAGETPAESAARELLEETGCRAGKLTLLGSCSPNPALFKNHFHCFLAEDLVPTGKQELDSDELLNYSLIPMAEVIAAFGSDEYSHAFTGTAMAFYMRHIGFVPKAE